MSKARSLLPTRSGFWYNKNTIIKIKKLFKKVKATSFKYYALLAIVWILIAIVFDYFFLVKAFKPTDGYYKLDVYLYYALTFVLPMIVGLRKKSIYK